MEPDFSGYATKAGLKCSDGRTIMKDAFAHQDKMTVPMVWAHGHNDPELVLGHAVLESRDGDIYTYGFFNDTPKGLATKKLVQHGDITMMSIFANNLVEKQKQVFHGAIREVSLVLAGANPGARIDHVAIQHSDDPEDITEVDDEAIIYTGLELELQHADTSTATADSSDRTFADVYEEMTDEQKEVCHMMIGAALDAAGLTPGGDVKHTDVDSADDTNSEDAPTGEGSEPEVGVTEGTKPEDSAADDVETDGTKPEDSAADDTQTDGSAPEDNNEETLNHQEGTQMNVFEQSGAATTGPTLSHDQLKTIVTDAEKMGSFKESLLSHAVEYGIENIDILFPDAKAASNSPEVIGRRTEWVNDVMNGTKHSPFSRIKSTAVDLTADEARAKGYVKGNLKKDEIIRLLKRVTTPTTIYKKQKLDRDDVVDITDLNVVAWLKAEMRLMLDEELARAVLLGDGRESDDEDKINEDHIRPIAYDNDMYAHQLVVGGDLTPNTIVESVLRARTYYKGTGTPTLYTTDSILTDLLLDKDKVGRRLYESEAVLAAQLRVAKIVTVEVMEDYPDVVGIIVNLADYTLGADSGGNVSMFDDFDIDYNQYKYLIETRVSGALTKPKSALVIKRTLGTMVSPGTPSYNGTTHTITFPSTAGVVYTVDGTVKTGTLVIDETTEVEARPGTGYSFPANTVRDWTYVYTV